MKSNLRNTVGALLAGAFLSMAINAQSINLQLQGDYPVGTAIGTPRFAVGDVNGDGRSDLVTLNPGNLSSIGPISTFLNNGAGGFGAALNTPGVSLSPTAAVVGDFNEDGNADLAVSQTGTFDGINIRLGNGSGNFLTGTGILAERGSPSIAMADFNRDNHLDLAICNNQNQLRVLNGIGNGTFGAAASFTTAAVCMDLVTADFNADGRPDLAVAMRLAPLDRGVQVFLNNGTGFDPAINIGGAPVPEELIAADFNRDCIPDLAVAQFASSINNTPIFILLGNGNGTFTAAPTVNVSNFPRYMTTGDFNRDKKVDLVLRRNVNNNPSANSLTVLPGNGSGGFGTPFEAPIGNATSSTEMQVATIDANKDGKDDLIIGRQGGFLLYNGNSPSTVRTEYDFDDDLKADLAVFRPSGGDWFIQQSTRGFKGVHWGVSTDIPAVGDYDGDYKADIAVWRANGWGDPSRSYFFILRSSDATFQPEQFGRSGDVPLSGDWDGDGRADAAVYRDGAAAGDQSFFFYRPSSVPGSDFTPVFWGTNGDQPVRGDFDGDGRRDAALFRPSNAVWYILQSSNGQPRFQSFGLASDRRAAADYDADGRADLAVFRSTTNTWYILNSATGSVSYVPWGIGSDSLVPADYNGDGRADVATYRPSDQRWYVPPCASYTGTQQKFGTTGDVAVQAVP